MIFTPFKINIGQSGKTIYILGGEILDL